VCPLKKMQKIFIKRQNSHHIQKKGGCELFFSLALSLWGRKDETRRTWGGDSEGGERGGRFCSSSSGLFFSRSGSCRLFFLRRVRKKRRK